MYIQDHADFDTEDVTTIADPDLECQLRGPRRKHYSGLVPHDVTSSPACQQYFKDGGFVRRTVAYEWNTDRDGQYWLDCVVYMCETHAQRYPADVVHRCQCSIDKLLVKPRGTVIGAYGRESSGAKLRFGGEPYGRDIEIEEARFRLLDDAALFDATGWEYGSTSRSAWSCLNPKDSSQPPGPVRTCTTELRATPIGARPKYALRDD